MYGLGVADPAGAGRAQAAVGDQDSTTWGELACLDAIVSSTLRGRRMFKGISVEVADSFACDGSVWRDGIWSWIIFVDPGSGNQLGLDLNPPPDGQLGRVLSIVHDPAGLFMLAPSYRAWFERLIERYESGRYVLAVRSGHGDGDRQQSAWPPVGFSRFIAH